MEKYASRNWVVNLIIGIFIILFTVYTFIIEQSYSKDYLKVILGIIIALVSLERYFFDFKRYRSSNALTVVFIEVAIDLFSSFMLITRKGDTSFYLGIVLYARGFAYFLILELVNYSADINKFILNMAVLTLGAYIWFSKNTFEEQLITLLMVLLFLVSFVFIYISIRQRNKKLK